MNESVSDSYYEIINFYFSSFRYDHIYAILAFNVPGLCNHTRIKPPQKGFDELRLDPTSCLHIFGDSTTLSWQVQ